MSFEVRPSNNAAFAERIRSAEIRKAQELERVDRRPRVSDRNAASARKRIEQILEKQSLEQSFLEVWELI